MASPYVVVIGGIGGNELWTAPSPPVASFRVWLNVGYLLRAGMGPMKLSSDGKSADPTFGKSLVGRLVLADYYGVLSNYLAARKLIPVSFQQDYRLRIADVIPDLIRLMKTLSGDGPVHVVAHSNGGMVLSDALNTMTQADRTALVGKVVGLGVPHRGSWSAAQLLGGVQETERSLSLAFGPGVFEDILQPGGNVRDVIGSWPAPYELLPDPAIKWPGLGTDVASLYQIITWANVVPSVRLEWLANAASRWATWKAPPADVVWLDIVGVNGRTPVNLLPLGLPWHGDGYQWSAVGDGAVTSATAQIAGHQVVVTNADHGSLPYTPAVMDATYRWIVGTL